MPVVVQCPACNASLKVPEDKLGKRGRCPKCREVFDLQSGAQCHADARPAAEAVAPAPADGSLPAEQSSTSWYVGSHDGNQYGPVTKDELDRWVAEGSVTAACELFCEGDSDWRPAVEVYPQLAAEVAPSAEAGQADVWNVIDSVNLYHTGIGVCDWQIHLCEEGILAIPEGMKNALAAGVAAGVAGGAGGAVQNPLAQALSRGGPQQIADEGEPKWMRFPLDQIRAIIVQKKMLAGSRLFVDFADGSRQKFATDSINATHQARWVIRHVYQDRYREEKFKKPADRKRAFR